MLFNSYIFILLFLPVTLFVFFQINRFGQKEISILWVVVASLFFYAWWNPSLLGLIIGSIVVNYALGYLLSSEKKSYGSSIKLRLLILGITFNILVLGYYKYVNFFVQSFNGLSHSTIPLSAIALPLAISFFTFQQIAYLVDAYSGKSKEYNFLHYCFFVTFFPHLIAGPIIHYKEMMPQIVRKGFTAFNSRNFVVGTVFFSIGLFKKVVIADHFKGFVGPVFDVAAQINGTPITFFEAWIGILAFSFQIYFDFSGYSDMAIGLARMFNIRFPLNFHSPYKALDIIDFWRRWHMTLSRFLKDYIYIPLGGNKFGQFQQSLNIMITMSLGGLWHGASWSFVLWGILHGVYLVINHQWKNFCNRQGWFSLAKYPWLRYFYRFLTFMAVVFAWVLFRAENFNAIKQLYSGMIGAHGFLLWDNYQTLLNKIFGLGDRLQSIGWEFGKADFFSKESVVSIILVWIGVSVLPNTQQFLSKYRPALDTYSPKEKPFLNDWLRWRPTIGWAIAISLLLIVTISLQMNKAQAFIYFQF